MPDMIVDAYCIAGTERDTCLPVDALLRELHEAGIDKAVIAPEDRELAVANADGNDRILSIASQYAGRFIAACGINPWHGASAIAELKRCISSGARMLVLAPALQGFIPTDELCDELLDCAAQWKVPVYFHTGPHSSGGPTQVVLVAEKHRDTDIILGHCGATDHAWDMTTILKNHRLDNLWFELSLVRPWAAANYVEIAGSSKFIWGSSSPRNSSRFELAQLAQYLPIADYPDIYGSNLTRLMSKAESRTISV